MNVRMTCPWESWRPTTMYFCETALCAWVKTPGNAWSSFFHLAIGFYLWFRWKKTHSVMAKSWFVTCTAIAFGSFFLHASMTFAGEFTDLSGLFLLTAFTLLWNLERYHRAPLARFWAYFAGLALAPLAAMLAFGSVGVSLFKALVACSLGVEFALWRRGDNAPYVYLALNCLTFYIAYKVWWLDVDKAWCNPHSHAISGHVVWHLLSALSLIPLAKFYEPFRR